MSAQTYWPTALLATGLIAFASAVSAEEMTYEIDGFDRVVISSGLSAVVEGGKDFSIRAESSDKRTLRLLDIYRTGDTLYVRREQEWSGLTWFRARKEATVYVTLPVLEGVEANAGSDVYFSGNVSEDFLGEASSGADLVLDGVDAAKIELRSSSGADLRVSGKCGSLSAEASSGASIRAEELECMDVTAEASSGATARVYASETLKGEASSGGDVWVGGSPKVLHSNESSGGDVHLD